VIIFLKHDKARLYSSINHIAPLLGAPWSRSTSNYSWGLSTSRCKEICLALATLKSQLVPFSGQINSSSNYEICPQNGSRGCRR